MKCTKMFTIATLAVAATFSTTVNAQVVDNNTSYQDKVQSLPKSGNTNKVITDTLFSNASPQEKARIAEQIKKYSQLQYGFGTASANVSPTKDPDVTNNIKSHDPATVKSQMGKMREAEKEIPQIQTIETTRKVKP